MSIGRVVASLATWTVLGTLPLSAAAVDAYVCTPEQAIGFAFDKSSGQWKAGPFRPTEKFILKRSNDPATAWELRKPGEDYPAAQCEKDFTAAGLLFCVGVEEFRMNRNTLRFLTVFPFGYWTDDPRGADTNWLEGANTPRMQIGECAPL